MHEELFNKKISDLIARGYDINQPDEDGDTLLYEAAHSDDISAANLLIENNADVNNANNRNGCTPLHVSAFNNHLAVAELLIANGADVNKLCSLFGTPLHAAAQLDSYSVAKLLIDNGADVCMSGGMRASTPLHNAAGDHSLSVLKLLIDNGAEVNALEVMHSTPLHYAAGNLGQGIGDAATITEVLIMHGANIDATDIWGTTPLHCAAQVGSENVIEILLHAGAKEDVVNGFDERPKDLVLKDGELGLSENVNNIINKVVEVHIRPLLRKRKQLIQTDDYGIEDRSKWYDELEYFITHLITPNFNASNTYMKWFLHKKKSTNVLIRAVDDAVELEGALLAHLDDTSSYSEDMDPIEYEYLCADILNQSGWQARVTNATGDQGVDVFAEMNGNSVVLQCKKHSSPVGNKAVQEAYAGKGFMGADFAIVATNNTFTPSAKKLATTLGVLLLHHDELHDINNRLSLTN